MGLKSSKMVVPGENWKKAVKWNPREYGRGDPKERAPKMWGLRIGG